MVRICILGIPSLRCRFKNTQPFFNFKTIREGLYIDVAFLQCLYTITDTYIAGHFTDVLVNIQWGAPQVTVDANYKCNQDKTKKTDPIHSSAKTFILLSLYV